MLNAIIIVVAEEVPAESAVQVGVLLQDMEIIPL
jgi:hypothetical protein